MRSWQIFKIWGIPFKVHPYWFVILFLFSWSISNQVNLSSGDIYNNKEAWIIGFLTSFFLLSSIIFHEVFHTFVSLNQGVKIKKITFYFLGAILQIDKYCQTALGNIKIAIVRPLLCFATASILLLISNNSASQEQIAVNVISRVGIFNLFLGFLNLIPIGSLDGGNLLKSIIWHFSGSKNKGRNFLNKVNLLLSFFVLFFGIICLFRFNFYFGFILSFLGLFGVNSSKSESQFFKIENILKFSKVSEIKLKPLRKIEYDSNFSEFNTLIKNKKDINDLFDILIDKTSLDDEIRYLIIYKKSLFNADSSSENELLKMLDPIIKSNSIWKSHALYLMAEFFYNKKQNQKAKEFFEKIIVLENSNIDILRETQVRLNRDLSD